MHINNYNFFTLRRILGKSSVLICPKCKTELDINKDKFCYNCGEKVSDIDKSQGNDFLERVKLFECTIRLILIFFPFLNMFILFIFRPQPFSYTSMFTCVWWP